MHFLHQHKIKCNESMKSEVSNMIENHIDAVVHHVVSLSSLVAMLDGKQKVDVSHLQAVRTYVKSKCSTHIKGGMPSDFYGYEHPAYASQQDAGVQVSEINWNKQEARPAQGPAQQGGGDKELQTKVENEIQSLSIKVSKTAIKGLIAIIEGHLRCLAHDLHQQKVLTVSKVRKVLNKQHHRAFE